MTTKTDFPACDWRLLTRAPLEIWCAMVGADLFVQSPSSEEGAFASGVAAARSRFAEHELVQSVLDHVLPPTERTAAGAVCFEAILSNLDRIAEALEERCTPAEASEFKRFLVWFGDHVARATSEGVVDSGLRVSQREQKFLRDVRESLRYRP